MYVYVLMYVARLAVNIVSMTQWHSFCSIIKLRSCIKCIIFVVAVALIIWGFYKIFMLYIHTVNSKFDDNTILAQYNRYVCSDYVSPRSYTEDDYDQARIVLPNVCKYLHTVVYII